MIPEWCGVIGGAFGAGEFAGALKGAQVARLAKAGDFAAAEAARLGEGATMILAGMGKTAKLANYVGLAVQADLLRKNWKDMPPGERGKAILQLLAFAGMAAAHEAMGRPNANEPQPPIEVEAVPPRTPPAELPRARVVKMPPEKPQPRPSKPVAKPAQEHGPAASAEDATHDPRTFRQSGNPPMCIPSTGRAVIPTRQPRMRHMPTWAMRAGRNIR